MSSHSPTPAGRGRKVVRGLAVLLAAVLLYAAGVVVVNRFQRPPAVESARVTGSAAGPAVGAEGDDGTLRLVTWNVGYAGMGAEADFVADGGEQLRPASADLVRRNLAAVRRWVEGEGAGADVYLFQEAALPSWNTHGVDVLAALTRALPGYARVFGADLRTRGLPPPWRIAVGNAVFSRRPVAGAERRGLPLEPEYVAGLFRKGYRMHVVRLAAAPGAARWVLVNVHLAAFDDGAVRRRQLRAVLDFAVAEHRRGHRVVVGGDWNLRLADTAFPHRTAGEHLFWIRDFPPGLLPPGWHWAVDPAVPTVRTAHQPYVAGDNYVTVIDGFLLAPDVELLQVRGVDLGFAHTDHQPVEVRVRSGER